MTEAAHAQPIPLRLAAALIGCASLMEVVLVTHHLEEIPPACTHVLALHKGAVLTAGPITEVITNSTISKLFGAAATVSCSDGTWGLTLTEICGTAAF